MNYLKKLFFDENDFIKELNENNMKCYLTGNALTNKILYKHFHRNKMEFNYCLNGSNLILSDFYTKDCDIYIPKMNPFEVYSILKKYGDVRIYGSKNIENVRLILNYKNTLFEFTNNCDYGATLNSIKYLLHSLNDINIINVGKICSEDQYKLKDLMNLKWKNENETKYFESLENIMRCFTLSSEFKLNIDQKTFDNMKKSIDNGFDHYSKSVIFNEMYKILNSYNCDRFVRYMHSFGILKMLNMNYTNIENVLNRLLKEGHNGIDNMAILIASSEINNYDDWVKESKIYESKYFTKKFEEQIIIIKYYKKFAEIKNKYDMLSFVNELNELYYYNREIHHNNLFFLIHEFSRFNDYMECDVIEKTCYSILKECYEYPFSINEIELKGEEMIKLNINVLNINKTKRKLLDLIYKDVIKNTYEDLTEYVINNPNLNDDVIVME